MPKMMAAVFAEPGRIVLESRPVPDVGPLDALVRISTTTICGTDVHILRGEYPVAKGLIVGHEPVGIIEKLGSQVQGYKEGQRVIGLGMWLGLIMAFNVWFLIWPNQKIVLGIVDGTPEQKAKAGTTAMIFSRTNFLLSFPMLYCMIAQHAIGAA